MTPQCQKTLDEKLARMVIWDLQPFSIVEDRGFRSLLHLTSTLSAEKLKATLRQMGLPDLKPVQDCPTRWNSTFYMLQRFVRLSNAIITTLALVNSAISTLTHDEWEAIEEACEVLQPFEETTLEISAERYEIINIQIHTYMVIK
ncbi:zinc finger BED domain-containing protein 4-like [Scomber scombrus]|uniref:Zinc finger BED domain-containing protein 4-like n=1 Tax=Scomber scombrus TaxID=13677 RepID=A0AAV1P702_SCOSC